MTDLDDEATSRVIGIHDGARQVGWLEAMEEVAAVVGELARRQRVCRPSGGTYAEALTDLLDRMQARMAEKRQK